MISGIQSKITRHEEKLKNMTHNEDKNQSIKTDRYRTETDVRISKREP